MLTWSKPNAIVPDEPLRWILATLRFYAIVASVGIALAFAVISILALAPAVFHPNYADETTDFGVPPQKDLRADDRRVTQTPTTIPGAHVIGTSDLYAAIQRDSLDGSPFVMVDALSYTHPNTIRGAKRIPLGGASGNFDDENQQRLRAQLMLLTKNKLAMPIVLFCGGATCWESYNASLRAEKMGFTRVYWYRGGLASWLEAGMPMN